MSVNCGLSYFMADFPQPLQRSGALFTFISLFIFSVTYLIMGIKIVKNDSSTKKVRQLSTDSAGILDILIELFRRGILNSKVFELAIIRS